MKCQQDRAIERAGLPVQLEVCVCHALNECTYGLQHLLCFLLLASCLLQVIVAHRLSTIMDADQILVLAKGQVVECGNHATLVAAGGLYASMWARQQDSSSALPSPAPKRELDGGVSSSSSEADGGEGDSSCGGGSKVSSSKPGISITGRDGVQTSRTVQQRRQQAEVEEVITEEARAGFVEDREPRSSLSGLQSPPPSLPPLPHMQRRLNMQQQQPQAASQQQQHSGLVGSRQQQHSGNASGRNRAGSTDAPAAPNSAAAAADDGDDAGDSTAPRVRSTRRCNSSCGHGRHANFWSRVSQQGAWMIQGWITCESTANVSASVGPHY